MRKHHYYPAPSNKQIKYVENICNVLNIRDFPTCSQEFTMKHYSQFIDCYAEDYYRQLRAWDDAEDAQYLNDSWPEPF